MSQQFKYQLSYQTNEIFKAVSAPFTVVQHYTLQLVVTKIMGGIIYTFESEGEPVPVEHKCN